MWVALLLTEGALIFTFWELRNHQHYNHFLYGQSQVTRGLVFAPEVGVWREWGGWGARWGRGSCSWQPGLTSSHALKVAKLRKSRRVW